MGGVVRLRPNRSVSPKSIPGHATHFESMFPEDLAFDALPEQHMYKIDIDACQTFSEGSLTGRMPARTDDIILAVGEGEPGSTTEWHTHMPDTDQLIVCLQGKLRARLQLPDGDEQVLDVEPTEVLYLPGGARHTLDVVGDEYHRSLVILPNASVTRMEDLAADETDEPEAGDAGAVPIGLWIDRDRDEVVMKDDAAVTD